MKTCILFQRHTDLTSWTLHHTLVYALDQFEGSSSGDFWMLSLTKPQVQCPFSSCLTPVSSPLCQPSLEQMGRISMASHRPTQRHVKQAVTGMGMPSTATLYHHMGIKFTPKRYRQRYLAWFASK